MHTNKMFLKLIVFNVLVCAVFCQYLNQNSIFSYELPDNDNTKSLNITIDSLTYQFKITFECYNYDSLQFFEVRLYDSQYYPLRNGISLHFMKCFNNATDNDNYKYHLARWFNSLPYFEGPSNTGYPLIMWLDKYAEVNSDALFKNFDFRKFNAITLINLGFSSSKFLNHFHCETCIFNNNGCIDFNEFPNNNTETHWLQTIFTKLNNFNRNNLKKFIGLKTLIIKDFDLDDYNALNVPALFEYNVNITEINFEKSKEKITLHEEVFRGLKNIQSIMLQGLQLDSIPNDLFKDLPELDNVFLSSNNIKAVDPSIFQANKKFSLASFTDNPFYTEKHDKLESFDFGGKSIRLELGNFTEHSFDLMEQLIKCPNLTSVLFQSFLIDNFNFEDFRKIQSVRHTLLEITFQIGEPALDLEYIKSFENIIQPRPNVDHQLDTIIHVQFSGDAICHDCTMIKQLFPHYLNHYNKRPGFYFNDSRLFVEFIIPDSCNHLEDKFDETFTENCPEICVCKFNPLTDKIKINCNNKNLTEIPRISYPTQYTTLRAIELYFENNSLSVLTSANQDSNVLQKLTSLNLQNNKIETFSTDGKDLLKNIWTLNLCGNPALINTKRYYAFNLARGYRFFSNFLCNEDGEHQRTPNYIKEIKSNELDEYLNGLKCKHF